MARWPGSRRYHWCDLGLDRTGCYSSRQGDPANSKAIDETRLQESKHLAHCFRSPRFLGSDLFVVVLSLSLHEGCLRNLPLQFWVDGFNDHVRKHILRV